MIVDFGELASFVELTKFTEKIELAKKFLPPANPHLYTEHGIYAVEYLYGQAWVSCLTILPPSSCTPAH